MAEVVERQTSNLWVASSIPDGEQNFFFSLFFFFYLIILENFVIFLYQSITIATIILWKLSKTNILQALQLYCK